MALSDNLQFLRSHSGITQEQLAEQMEVSRQSVSKWESGTSYPEMDTLLKLCDLFSIDLDTLLRGDARQSLAEDSAGYDRHMNQFARRITGGVAIILGGITAMLILIGLGDTGAIGTIVFLSLVTVAVAVFIVAGLSHGDFVKRNPTITPFYSQQTLDKFHARFPVLIAVPVCLILIGTICTTVLGMQPKPAELTPDQWGGWIGAVFLLCVNIAAPALVWTGIQHAKYDIPAYNKEQTPSLTDRTVSSLWGCAMVGATAVYVGLGLAMDLWHNAWVIYPVVALVCVAITIFLRRNENN